MPTRTPTPTSTRAAVPTQTPTPTSTRAAVPTQTPTPTPTPGEVAPVDEDASQPEDDDSEFGIGMPVVFGGLGVVVLGGGLIWARYTGEDGSESTPDRPGYPGPGQGPSTGGGAAGSGPGWGSDPGSGGTGDSVDDFPAAPDGADRFDSALEAAVTSRDRAQTALDDSDYTAARQALDRAQRRVERAAEIDADHDLGESGRIADERAVIESLRERTAREPLETRLEDARDRIGTAAAAIDDGDRQRASGLLDAAGDDLDEIRDSATERGLDDLTVDVRTAMERCESLREATGSGGIPATIPTPSPTPRSLSYDQFIDRELVGQGGNADVYRAVVETSGVELPVAVKEPRVEGTLHSEQVEQLMNESETWDRLDDHDHVVTVFDWGTTPRPWIATEYMDGGHLGERAGESDLDQALWTAIAVTKAVRHAHRRGVVHLDLKPENVLFRGVESGWDAPKVTDWNLSKQLLDDSKRVEGLSPQYSAPEQFDDDYGSTDDVTDVYQLGAVFYELVTGRPPFEGSPAAVMHQVLHDDPVPPSDVADVPPELDDVLSTALARERSDRYESVLYLRDALQRLFDGGR